MRILITGATGNVGIEVIRFLFHYITNEEVIAGVRNIEKSQRLFNECANLKYRYFDFEDVGSCKTAFEGIDILFLLRPPQIADVDKVFRPMIDLAYKGGIRKVVFLSVQGADKMSYIPHAKIEKLIKEKGLKYVFLRPSYFMQNLTTTLADDIRAGKIFLPAGKAKFNWVDVTNIGEAAAKVLLNFDKYSQQALDITGSENLSFPEVVSIINATLGINLEYKSPNPIPFFRHKKHQGVATPMIMVMIMLHFLPRFQKPPHISNNYLKITGSEPILLSEFVVREKDFFLG